MGAIATLHAVIDGKAEPMALAEWIAVDAVFHSPVMHTPQAGKERVMHYLGAAFAMFADAGFTYRRDIIDGTSAALEFTARIDEIEINGVDLITLDDEGKIGEFTVMIRPLKAIEKVRETMLAILAAPDT